MEKFSLIRRAIISTCLAACLPTFAIAADKAERVLSVGGSLTEIVYALGEEHRLVGRDSTSGYPKAAEKLPNVGYVRRLSAEGVLSLAPDLIIAEHDAGPLEVVEILENASIPFTIIPEVYTIDGIVKKITDVGVALDVEDKSAKLASKVRAELEAADAIVKAYDGPKKRVLFILSTRGGRINAAGLDTSANGIIEMAGGVNAIQDFSGYRLLTDEAIDAAAPDMILMMDRGGDHAASDQELFAMPSLITTPAVANKAVTRIDGMLLLGFGPRTAQAIIKLNEALYGG